MIRTFDIKDLDQFEPTDKSVPAADIMPAFQEESCWIYTQENNTIRSIIWFKEEVLDEWVIFIMPSKYFKGFDCRELRRFSRLVITKFRPKKIWSISPIDALLDEWHKFFGFSVEKLIEFNDVSYNMWVRT